MTTSLESMASAAARAERQQPAPCLPPETPVELARTEELELTRLIFTGSKSAENRFVRRFTPGLIAMLRGRCADAELCKDLAQDTLRIVLIRLRAGKIEQPKALTGFIRGTALNLLANELRRSERRLAERNTDKIESICLESSDPYQAMERKDLAENIREVIGNMKIARDRELLWRFYVDQAPKDILCACYALSPEHFDRVLHRARNRLKALWQQHIDFE